MLSYRHANVSSLQWTADIAVFQYAEHCALPVYSKPYEETM